MKGEMLTKTMKREIFLNAETCSSGAPKKNRNAQASFSGER